MMSLLFLASALVLGAAVTRRLGLSLLRFEAPAMAVTLGLVLWTWLSFLCALILPFRFSLPLTILIAGLSSLVLWRTSPKQKTTPLPGGRPAWILWAVFSLLCFLVIGALMWTHDLLPMDGGLYSAAATWADFGLHTSLISHFVAAGRLSFDFPIAAGAKLTYPFMIDLLSAWFNYGGWSLQWSLFVPGLLLTLAFLQLLMGFGVRLFGRLGGAVLALGTFLLCGSAVGVFVALGDLHASHQALGTFLANLPRDYTALSTPNAQVTNLIADTLLPQRAFLMGFAVFGVVIILLLQLRRAPTRPLAVFTGALTGLLPLVHAHTFVILIALVAGFWIEAVVRAKRIFNTWTLVGVAALATALPQIAWQTISNGTGTGGHLAPGWTIQPGESLWLFWSHNFGLTGLLILGVAVLLISQANLRKYLVWYAPMLIIFLFANIYSLQPFEYDNLKLILYVYLFTYLFAAYGALWLIRRNRTMILPVAVIFLLITASGSLAVLREFERADQFASAQDIALANWIKASTKPSDVFLATDRPNQPISTLAGRSIVSGYRGWLYDYHLDYTPRLAAIQSALSGQLTSDNAYKAQYVAVASYEAPEWTVDRSALTANYTLVYSNPSWEVYRLKP
jgi:hypothetical protein